MEQQNLLIKVDVEGAEFEFIEGAKNKIENIDYLIIELLQDSITEEIIFHGKELVISFRLPCGFTVAGRSAVVNAERFDLNIGRLLCYEDAIRQLWLLEGYRVQWKMYLDQLKEGK